MTAFDPDSEKDKTAVQLDVLDLMSDESAGDVPAVAVVKLASSAVPGVVLRVPGVFQRKFPIY